MGSSGRGTVARAATALSCAVVVAWLFPTGLAAILLYGGLGLLGGTLLRPALALPLLGCGLAAGFAARSMALASGFPTALVADGSALRLLGQGAFGLLLGLGPLLLLLALPVLAGRWLGALLSDRARAPRIGFQDRR